MNRRNSSSIGYPSVNLDARPIPLIAAITRACASVFAATTAALPPSNCSHHMPGLPHDHGARQWCPLEGGFVSIDSVVGRGTTISIYLSRTNAPDAAEQLRTTRAL